jgi:hypothetical protein
MKNSEIQVGGHYKAKVSGRIVTVRVDAIYQRHSFNRETTVFDVTNLMTGRKTTFKSAMKFRRAVLPESVAVQRINRIEAKYSTEEGATETERQEAQELLQDIGPGMPKPKANTTQFGSPQSGFPEDGGTVGGPSFLPAI